MPAELVKARMQTQSFETLGQCLKDAIGRERGGFFGLYTGYTATMIRDLPYFALQLGFYGTFHAFLSLSLSFTKNVIVIESLKSGLVIVETHRDNLSESRTKYLNAHHDHLF